MKTVNTFTDAQTAIKDIYNQIEYIQSKNWDFRQRRIVNAHPSVDLYDYVVRKELNEVIPGTTVQETEKDWHKATFGLNEVGEANDKTPHFFVLYSGSPKVMRANAKVAPYGSDLILTIRQRTVDLGTWTEILDPMHRMIIPQGSTWIHEITRFTTALVAGSLLRIDVVQGDSHFICREVEVILLW